MQLIINFMSLRFSVSVRIAAFRPFERLYQKFVYINLTSFALYLLKNKISL